MNNITRNNTSQILRDVFSNAFSLSHKQQLEAEERCRERRNSYKVKAQRVKSPQQECDEQIKWAYDLVTTELTPFQRAGIGYLCFSETIFSQVYTSYGVVAANVGCNEKTVDRMMHALRILKLAFTSPRFIRRNGKMERTSNHTWLHPIFRHPKLREMLKDVSTFFSHAVKQVSRFLSIWLLFSRGKSSLQTENVPGEYKYIYKTTLSGESDTTSREYKLTHSREVNTTIPSSSIYSREKNISFSEGSSHNVERDTQLTVTREDTHARDERRAQMNREMLSQKIAELRAQLEPERDALKRLKAQAAREISELLKDRVTKTLHLSAKGQLYLMRYCDGALLYGLANLAHHGTIDTLTNLRLFEVACLEYCRENEIDVDFDKYDKLLSDLGYVESQPLCKKITLDKPLAMPQQKSPTPTKAETPVLHRTARKHVKPLAHDGQIAIDPFLQDSFSALANKLGYQDLVQNSNEKLDLKE